MIPPEAKLLFERNQKYARMIFESAAVNKHDLGRAMKELELAPTPKEIVHSECTINLYHFIPAKRKVSGTPLLIVPSLILRYYIMDLLKGHSLIEHLVNSGIDTYLLDWGIPGEENGKLTFDYYLDTFLSRAVRKVSRLSGARSIDLLGQCVGGTMAAIFSSLYPEKIRKLITLTAPFDFENAGLLALWTDKERFNVDKIVAAFENIVPADLLHTCFYFLDLKATVDRYKNLYNKVLDENFLVFYRAIEQWLNDKIPFPSLVFHKFIRDFYQENLLIKGKFLINGKSVDLRKIVCPLLNILAQRDHVLPERSGRKINEMVSGPIEYHLIRSGHVTLITLFPERFETYSYISKFLK